MSDAFMSAYSALDARMKIVDSIANNLEGAAFEHVEAICADGFFDQDVTFSEAKLREITAHFEYVVHGIEPLRRNRPDDF